MQRKNSESLFQEALKYFPGGVNSPVRAFRSVGGTPIFFEKGSGSKLFDVDGNEYIDFCASWGPLISGHANPHIVNAIVEQAASGTSFGAPTRYENKLASLILSNHNFIQKLRFVSSGTEAVMSALRLARAYTGKNKIIKFEGCYHGHSDSLLVKAGSGLVTLGQSFSVGVPDSFTRDTIVVPLNNEQALEEAFKTYHNEIACVIIEPIPANNGLLLQTPEFLAFVREICSKNSSLLIFDEVISGFRVGFRGASGYYGIKPDIITFGKIIGGGMPVGAYASSNEIMSQVSPEGNMYQAGTLSGNPLAMAAGYAQLSLCLSDGFYSNLENKTQYLLNGILNQTQNKVKIPFRFFSIGSVFWLAFTDRETIRTADDILPESMHYFKKLHALLLQKGIYLGPSGYEVSFVSSVHDHSDLDRSIQIFTECLIQI